MYMNPVPDANSLTPIAPYLLAKPNEWTLPSVEQEGMGPALFTMLMPGEVSEAAEQFSSTKVAAANECKSRVAAQTEAAKQKLAELGLPGMLEARNEQSGVPDTLWERILHVQAQVCVIRLSFLALKSSSSGCCCM